MSPGPEVIEEFECFSSRCLALVAGPGSAGSPEEAAVLVRRTLLALHVRFSRFSADSELSLLNRDPRPTVSVSPLMASFAGAVAHAGAASGGLVDATLAGEIERAGYDRDLPLGLDLASALTLAPARTPAAPSAAPRWREIEVDFEAGMVSRPPGVRLDSGGLAKGLFADALGVKLATHPRFVLNCAGDLLLGGTDGAVRAVNVESPFDGRTLHTFRLTSGGIATSGIGRRSWLGASGKPAHHLLDPSTGRPAFTGIVQVTALARSALAAEIKAKAALLSGPQRAPAWLAEGGLIVFDDGSTQLVEPPPTVSLAELRPRVSLECGPAR